VIAEDIGLNRTLLYKALTLAQRAKASLTIMANNQDKEIALHLELIYQQKIADLAMLNGYQASRLNIEINTKYCAAPFYHQNILAEITDHNSD